MAAASTGGGQARLGKEAFVACGSLVKIYKVDDVEVVALQGLDLEVRAREMVAIIGPSGSGKSSLLNILGGLDTPSAGTVRVAGRDLLGMSGAERMRYRRDTVGFLWQNVSRNLVPYLSAVENVELPMILSGVFSRKRAHMLLDLVGLGSRLHHTPAGMSGGEKQRVGIAIALANSPPFVLADEPTGSLDTDNSRRLLEILDNVRTTLGVTVIIVTHDRSLARSVDRFVEIRDGKTSTEAVRLGSGAAGGIGEARGAPGAAHPETHETYTLLDSAGRLQVPPEMLAERGIKGRVKLVEDGERIVITKPDDQ